MELNREPRKKSRHLGQLIFDKGGKNIKWERESLFSKWCWENWRAAAKSMNLDGTLTACTKINSKWLKDLNIRQDTIKLLEENISKTLFDINHTRFFLGYGHQWFGGRTWAWRGGRVPGPSPWRQPDRWVHTLWWSPPRAI